MKNEEVKLNYLKCIKCNHEWVPRKPKVYVCPKCHTPKWKGCDQNGLRIKEKTNEAS